MCRLRVYRKTVIPTYEAMLEKCTCKQVRRPII